MITGPYHAIASLYGVMENHDIFKQRVKNSKNSILEKYHKIVRNNNLPLLCTYLGGEVVAKDDDAVIDFRIKGKWRDMKWKQLKHDMSDEKPRGGWMEFEYVMDLAPGTQNNYFKIDS